MTADLTPRERLEAAFPDGVRLVETSTLPPGWMGIPPENRLALRVEDGKPGGAAWFSGNDEALLYEAAVGVCLG